MDCTTTTITTPTISVPIVAQESDLHRDVRHIHRRLKTLADIMRPHVASTDMVDPVVRAHHALLRTRSIFCEALHQLEGE